MLAVAARARRTTTTSCPSSARRSRPSRTRSASWRATSTATADPTSPWSTARSDSVSRVPAPGGRRLRSGAGLAVRDGSGPNYATSADFDGVNGRPTSRSRTTNPTRSSCCCASLAAASRPRRRAISAPGGAERRRRRRLQRATAARTWWSAIGAPGDVHPGAAQPAGRLHHADHRPSAPTRASSRSATSTATGGPTSPSRTSAAHRHGPARQRLRRLLAREHDHRRRRAVRRSAPATSTATAAPDIAVGNASVEHGPRAAAATRTPVSPPPARSACPPAPSGLTVRGLRRRRRRPTSRSRATPRARVTILRGGTVPEPPIALSGGPYGIAVADFNADSRPDLAVSADTAPDQFAVAAEHDAAAPRLRPAPADADPARARSRCPTPVAGQTRQRDCPVSGTVRVRQPRSNRYVTLDARATRSRSGPRSTRATAASRSSPPAAAAPPTSSTACSGSARRAARGR